MGPWWEQKLRGQWILQLARHAAAPSLSQQILTHLDTNTKDEGDMILIFALFWTDRDCSKLVSVSDQVLGVTAHSAARLTM